MYDNISVCVRCSRYLRSLHSFRQVLRRAMKRCCREKKNKCSTDMLGNSLLARFVSKISGTKAESVLLSIFCPFSIIKLLLANFFSDESQFSRAYLYLEQFLSSHRHELTLHWIFSVPMKTEHPVSIICIKYN